jgi:GNAT superfamily N-acetyltransferase
MSTTTIRPVRTRSDIHRFVKFLWTIYDGNPAWVPPLIMDRKKLIDRAKNPFYRHADAEFFIAEQNGTMVGRIGAIVNHRHNQEHQDKVGFFGFFECVNDREVAGTLVDAAAGFLRRHGMTSMRGPANPSVNDEYGMLLEGFDLPPMILMPYNPPYYLDLMEACGFAKARDLYAYELTQKTVYTEKLERVTRAVRERHRLTFRSIDLSKFHEEVERIKQVYNAAWMKNWGAVPMTDEETDALAKDLRPIVVPDLVFFAEVDGKPVGFALSLPDINVALKYNRRGWLLPGVLRLFLHRRKIHSVRIIALGVLPEYQASGAAGVLFFETAQRALRLGYEIGEASWVLEDNTKMVRAAELMNGRLYKKYRLYEKPI